MQQKKKQPFNERSHVSKDYYDRLAREFREMDEFWANPYDTATWDMENELTREYLKDKDYIIDLGVGFYPHVESTSSKRVVCLDISGESLLLAKELYGKCNPQMTYVEADALDVPFDDAQFDGIIAGGELINHIPGEKLLKEMARILKPGGRVVLSIAMKWCLDSLYAVFDSFIGNRIGYSMTKDEASLFVSRPRSSSEVTWEVTPDLNLSVTLYSQKHLKEMLSKTPFVVRTVRSLNIISAIIPLPLQQNPKSNSLILHLSKALLRLDKLILSRIPIVRWFAGNVYLVLEKK